MATAAAAGAVAPRTRPVYTRIGALGLVLIALAPATLLTAGLASGVDIGGEIGFLSTIIVLPLLAAALVWRFGRWAKVLGIVISLLAALAMFWAVFGLAYPASPGDFLPGVLLPMGLVLGVGGNIAALVQTRRGHLQTEATAGERRVRNTVLGLLAVAIVVSGALSLAGRQTVADTAAAGATPIEMVDFAFAPRTVEATVGEPVRLLVHNSDGFVHTITSQELGFNETVLPGSQALVEFTPQRSGTFVYYCVPHSNGPDADPEGDEMAGRIVVR
ncbi:MAG TPA: cupredoxin domain-containing protein [Nitriliruptorales bacterium]|nr:cupredoxin domain-containing protein [Nitriliruptorales bacterium]